VQRVVLQLKYFIIIFIFSGFVKKADDLRLYFLLFITALNFIFLHLVVEKNQRLSAIYHRGI
jgi:hypothetical protein